MADFETTEAEQQIANNFKKLALGFKELDDKSSDVVKQTMLKELTSIMQECKRCLLLPSGLLSNHNSGLKRLKILL